jgi:hypothetical protein
MLTFLVKAEFRLFSRILHLKVFNSTLKLKELLEKRGTLIKECAEKDILEENLFYYIQDRW